MKKKKKAHENMKNIYTLAKQT